MTKFAVCKNANKNDVYNQGYEVVSLHKTFGLARLKCGFSVILECSDKTKRGDVLNDRSEIWTN